MCPPHHGRRLASRIVNAQPKLKSYTGQCAIYHSVITAEAFCHQMGKCIEIIATNEISQMRSLTKTLHVLPRTTKRKFTSMPSHDAWQRDILDENCRATKWAARIRRVGTNQIEKLQAFGWQRSSTVHAIGKYESTSTCQDDFLIWLLKADVNLDSKRQIEGCWLLQSDCTSNLDWKTSEETHCWTTVLRGTFIYIDKITSNISILIVTWNLGFPKLMPNVFPSNWSINWRRFQFLAQNLANCLKITLETVSLDPTWNVHKMRLHLKCERIATATKSCVMTVMKR